MADRARLLWRYLRTFLIHRPEAGCGAEHVHCDIGAPLVPERIIPLGDLDVVAGRLRRAADCELD